MGVGAQGGAAPRGAGQPAGFAGARFVLAESGVGGGVEALGKGGAAAREYLVAGVDDVLAVCGDALADFVGHEFPAGGDPLKCVG